MEGAGQKVGNQQKGSVEEKEHTCRSDVADFGRSSDECVEREKGDEGEEEERTPVDPHWYLLLSS